MIYKLQQAIFFFVVGFVWVGLVHLLYDNVLPPYPSPSLYQVPLKVRLLVGCVLAPLFEELFFRYIPLTFLKKAKLTDYNLLVLGFSSLIFGYAHGGLLNIPIQGALGFLWGYAFLKTDYNYWAIVIMHSLWNLLLITEIIKF